MAALGSDLENANARLADAGNGASDRERAEQLAKELATREERIALLEGRFVGEQTTVRTETLSSTDDAGELAKELARLVTMKDALEDPSRLLLEI